MLIKIFTAVLSIFLTTPLYAFDATSKEIKIVIPFAPGGGVDQTFRHFEKYASKKGIKFVPIYKPGAEGLIGMNEISEMPKDGYHISIGTAATIAIQRIKNPSSELHLVSGIRNAIPALVTHKDSGINSIQDLYKGDTKTFGIGAPGQRIYVDQIVELSNGQLAIIQILYKGGAPLVQDLLGNHIQLGVPPLIITKSHIDAGTLRVIAIGSDKKLKEFPNIPLIREVFKSWKETDVYAFILPKGTDPAAIKAWTDLLKEYTSDKTVQEEFLKDFNEPVPFGNEFIESTVKLAVDRLSKY